MSFSDFKMFIQHEIVRIIFACGFYINVEAASFEGIGVLWFLLALFVGRTLYDYLQLKIEDNYKKTMILMGLSFMGFLLGKIQWLPWSLDIMLTIMPLFYFGEKLKNYDFDLYPILKVVMNIVIWVVSFGVYAIIFNGRLDLNQRMYPFYPLCLLAAVSGTLIVSYFSRLIENWGGYSMLICKIVLYIGQNSLYLMLVHSMDFLIFDYTGFKNLSWPIYIITRICIDLFIFSIVMIIVEYIKKKKLKKYRRIKKV